jgi:hypothetical protein
MNSRSSVRQIKEIIISWDGILCSCVVSHIANDVLEKLTAFIFKKETLDRKKRIIELGDQNNYR